MKADGNWVGICRRRGFRTQQSEKNEVAKGTSMLTGEHLNREGKTEKSYLVLTFSPKCEPISNPRPRYE